MGGLRHRPRSGGAWERGPSARVTSSGAWHALRCGRRIENGRMHPSETHRLALRRMAPRSDANTRPRAPTRLVRSASDRWPGPPMPAARREAGGSSRSRRAWCSCSGPPRQIRVTPHIDRSVPVVAGGRQGAILSTRHRPVDLRVSQTVRDPDTSPEFSASCNGSGQRVVHGAGDGRDSVSPSLAEQLGVRLGPGDHLCHHRALQPADGSLDHGVS